MPLYVESGGFIPDRGVCILSYFIGGRVCAASCDTPLSRDFFGGKGRYTGDLHTGQYKGSPLLKY